MAPHPIGALHRAHTPHFPLFSQELLPSLLDSPWSSSFFTLLCSSPPTLKHLLLLDHALGKLTFNSEQVPPCMFLNKKPSPLIKILLFL